MSNRKGNSLECAQQLSGIMYPSCILRKYVRSNDSFNVFLSNHVLHQIIEAWFHSEMHNKKNYEAQQFITQIH